jgi:hypothetical protein
VDILFGLGIQNVYVLKSGLFCSVNLVTDEARTAFRNLLLECGYTEETVEALWKWYDTKHKKGVASF